MFNSGMFPVNDDRAFAGVGQKWPTIFGGKGAITLERIKIERY